MNEAGNQIPVAKPWIGEEEALAARRVILSGWVTQGPEVSAFEQEFAQSLGAAHACAVSSGTTALHVALKAIGLQPDDEVITVSHSFIATTSSIQYCGAIPVLVDIAPGTYNIDPRCIEAALTERTKAILCVHQMGMPCNLEGICAIASRQGLKVIEDAACAVGSEILWDGAWQPIGRPHGDIACFSFHPRKVLTTGEGGMLTTADPEYDQAFRLLRHHGMSIPDSTRHRSKEVLFESYVERGFNYRMTDIQAAVGREQLKRMPKLMERRRTMARIYGELVAEIPSVTVPVEPSWAKSNWQSYCIGLPDAVDQKRVMQRMLDQGVSTRRGIMCAHQEPANSNLTLRHSLRESESATDHSIVLPIYHELTAHDQQRIVNTLAAAIGHDLPG